MLWSAVIVLWSAIIVLWSAPRGWVESDGSIGKKGLGARRAFVGAFQADAGPSAFAVGMLRDFFFKKTTDPSGGDPCLDLNRERAF